MRFSRLVWVITAGLIGLVVASGAAREDPTAGMSPERLARVGAKAQEFIDANRLAGAVTVVYRRGTVVDVQAIGWQDKKRRIPMKRDMIFRLASMTKPITAVAALMLVEDGKIALQEPVDKWLPELANRRVLMDPNGPLDETIPSPRPITLRDLLMYRMGLGIPSFEVTIEPSAPIAKAFAAFSQGGRQSSPDEWITRLGQLPLVSAPGELFMYNLPSDVLGVLVARVSGMPFDVFLSERIFKPLGMKDTGFWVPAEKRSRLGKAYRMDRTSGLQAMDSRFASGLTADGPPMFPSGAAGLVSTADDYLTFARMLLHKGKVDGVRLLSPRTVDSMTTNYMTDEDREQSGFGGGGYWRTQGFGYGVAVITDPTALAPSVGSYHWDGAAGVAWRADPQEEMITIVLTQLNYASASPMIRDIRTMMYAAIVD